jgi:hypothetical protein
LTGKSDNAKYTFIIKKSGCIPAAYALFRARNTDQHKAENDTQAISMLQTRRL